MAVRNASTGDTGATGSSRHIICASTQANLTASSYLRPAGRPNYDFAFGTPLMRAGSVVGVSCSALIQTFVASGTLTIEAHINGVSVFSATSPTITANGVVSWSGEQAAGVDTFSALDLLQIFITEGAGNFSFRPLATVDVEIA